MAQDFHVSILSPSAKVMECQAKSLIVPGSQGYMTILPDHAQMVAELGFGELTMETGESNKSVYFLSGGFVEVEGGDVVILADVVEAAPKIDMERAKASRDRALQRLEASDDIDVDRANQALRRAEVRIMVAQTLAAVSK
ncbi:MAG: ATP synthase F1 subunit epsilon [Oligoflexus sp.]